MRRVIVCIAGAAAFAAPVAASGQDAAVQAALETHRRPLVMSADGLSGPGGGWLVERARAARFTLIGESHLNVETPMLTRALLAALRPAGYAAYVVEAGPESTRLLMATIARGGADAAEAMLTQHTFSIAFLDQREELDVVLAAHALGYDVWGIDQEFVGSPRLLLSRLRQLAGDAASRARIEGMLERETAAFQRFAQTGDQSGAFLASATSEDFDALAAAFPDAAGEGGRIVEQLVASADIYRAFGERRYYDNNAQRVERIKRNFLAHYARAGESPLSGRRAVIKMGSVHAGRGRSPMQVYDIGNFAAELAFAGVGESFHVLVLAAGSVGADGEFTSWLERAPHLAEAFELVTDDQPVVFDLAPLRPLLTQRARRSAELEELQETALRYDALVVFPRFHRATPIVPLPMPVGQ